MSYYAYLMIIKVNYTTQQKILNTGTWCLPNLHYPIIYCLIFQMKVKIDTRQNSTLLGGG